MSIAEAGLRPVRAAGQFSLFVLAFCGAIRRHGVPWRLVIREAYEIGIKSLPILLIIAGFVGTNLALQGYNAFRPLGGERLVGMFVALAGLRELAPIIAASMVAAKAGTEMASQIGVMRIREQIDALEVMAIDPYWYLVTPRVFGIVLVLPALTMISITTSPRSPCVSSTRTAPATTMRIMVQFTIRSNAFSPSVRQGDFRRTRLR